jgi:hypothetical protein
MKAALRRKYGMTSQFAGGDVRARPGHLVTGIRRPKSNGLYFVGCVFRRCLACCGELSDAQRRGALKGGVA